MNADRARLDLVSDESLAEKKLRIESDGGDVRTYTLQRMIGRGRTGVAWKAVDRLDRTWAIKFVLSEDYRTHSLAAEAARAAKVETRSLAHIEDVMRAARHGLRGGNS